ncbi:universal stress protein [Paenibacillus oryzisoli]|uniref:universal stress protein n=1 Tax=Paenibacillus oryzisoli TaxID=1850517 RepID=UPI003D2D59F4
MFCRKIVLAYDGSEGANKALEKTIELSKWNKDVHVYVLNVNQPKLVAAGEAYMMPAIASVEVQSELEAEARHTLEQAESRLALHAMCSYESLIDNNPAAAIVSFAETNDCDLIVIGNRGLSGLKKFLLGSVSHDVVQNASIPVLVVKEDM